MKVGTPKEVKNNENRVGLIPSGVKALVDHGNTVFIEKSAGLGSGIEDREYVDAGAILCDTAAEVYAQSDMIVKVKEPLPQEYGLMQEGQILFTYLHLAPEPELTQELLLKRITGIAFETVTLPNGSLPLLVPMSMVAGRMSVQVGAHFLEKNYGGRGMLLGGVPGVKPAKVTIIGGGMVGTNAAKIAVGMGAEVSIIDMNPQRLIALDDQFKGRVKTVMSNTFNIAEEVKDTDLLIGAVLIPGARAPHLVTEVMVKTMRPGSVIVDVAIDQGGSIETIDRITTHSDPVFIKHGVVHYSVANMPGAVARTSTYALANVTLPYALKLTEKGWKQACKEDSALAKGVNTAEGHVTFQKVAEAHSLPYKPIEELLI